MALPSPSPFSLPLHSLAYINRQQRGIHASRAAIRLGAHAVQPFSFGRSPPINTYGGPFIPPPEIHTAGHPLFPIPQPHSPSGAQKQTMGNWHLRGPHGWVFLHPPFWAHGQVTPNPKKIGGAILGTPILGPLGSLALFCSFGILIISGTPGSPPHLPIPNLSPASPPILGQT